MIPAIEKTEFVLFLSILVVGCDGSGRMYNSTTPVGWGNAHAFGSQGGDISLVSLIFPDEGEVESVSAVDRFTGNPIPFLLEEGNGRTVVTLELAKGRIANPLLVSDDGDNSFLSQVHPTIGLSTFDGLQWGPPTVFLRDHGWELELWLDEEVTVPSEEFVTLWISGSLTKAVRAAFTNPGSADAFELYVSSACEVAVKRKERLVMLSAYNFQLGDHESVGLVITPQDEAATLTLSMTN